MFPALFALLQFGVVLKEEAYLMEKFGQEYEDYRSEVRRWL
jgi:protein-S-isoprenylcysteine O-methyltransferase Ste14